MKACPVCQHAYPADQALCPSDGVRLEELSTSGTRICAGYHIIEFLGQGGLSEVYKAVGAGSGQPYALKVLKAQWMDAATLVQNFREAALRSRDFAHPHAAHVEALEQADDGRPVIVTEYIPGLTVQDLVAREGRLPVDRACSIAWRVASVLSALHEVGLVHQAIKPASIVMGAAPMASPPGRSQGVNSSRSSGNGGGKPGNGSGSTGPAGEVSAGEVVKVLNCGLGAIADHRRRDIGHLSLKDGGTLAGDPRYFSPEQAVGKTASELDGRSDLYSLGLLLYQMLSGDIPFQGSAMEVLLAHLLNPPKSLRASGSPAAAPDELDGLVMRLLAKNPSSRPPSATAVMEELERWAEPRRAVPGPERFLRMAEAEITRAPAQVDAVDAGVAEHATMRSPGESAPPSGPSSKEHPSAEAHAPIDRQGGEPAQAQPPRDTPGGDMGTPVDDFPLAPLRAAFTGSGGARVRGLKDSRTSTGVPGLNRIKSPVVARTVKQQDPKWISRVAWAMVVVTAGVMGWYYRASLSTLGQRAWSDAVTLGKARAAKQSGSSEGGPSGIPAADTTATPRSNAGSTSKGAGKSLGKGPSPSARRTPSSTPDTTSGEPTGRQASMASQVAEGSGPQDASAAASQPQVDRGQAVAASVAEADRMFQAGEYDRAIRLYQAGLAADPNNEVLRRKIVRARSAKAAEAKYLGDQ